MARNRCGTRAMSTINDNSPELPARHKKLLVAWVIFLAVVFGFGWYKSAENARDWRKAREWDERYQQLMKDGEAEWTRWIEHFRSLQVNRGSQRLLEEELNGGQPFDLRHEGEDEVYEWTEPKFGGKVWLRFRSGELRGHSGNWGTDRLLAVHPQPLRQAHDKTADRIRRRIASAGVYTWLAAFVVWMVVSRRRLVAAQVMLAAALASGMAWLVNPAYTITGRGVFSNDNLFWAALMIVISVYLLAVTLSVHAKTELEVPRVRFGLRQLLLAVTVAAILLAAGPFGFVTFNVAVGGMLLFMLVYHHYRSRLESAA